MQHSGKQSSRQACSHLPVHSVKEVALRLRFMLLGGFAVGTHTWENHQS
jgi:hypothetical protein